jgi:hypothetical protein
VPTGAATFALPAAAALTADPVSGSASGSGPLSGPVSGPVSGSASEPALALRWAEVAVGDYVTCRSRIAVRFVRYFPEFRAPKGF